jgi:hypothetical protein
LIYCVIASVVAVTYFVCLELFVLIPSTFKRYSGKYFWSILIATTGITLYTTANILTLFENKAPMLFVHLCFDIGWGCAITGFSLVLWSRLELILNVNAKPWFMRILLAVILFDGICWTAISLGISLGLTLKYHKAYEAASVINYFQISLLVTQEIFLSSLYIYHTARFLSHKYGKETRKVIFLLVSIQLVVVALDAVLLGLWFSSTVLLAAVYHPLSQSIKLRLEFVVLNQLQELVKPGSASNLGGVGTIQSLQVQEVQETKVRPWLPKESKSSHTVSTGVAVLTTPTYPNNLKLSTRESSGRERELEKQVTDSTLLGVESNSMGNLEAGGPPRMEDEIDRLESLYLGRGRGDMIV